MNSSKLKILVKKDVAEIIISNPAKGNALNIDSIRSLRSEINSVSNNSTIRFLLFRGEGKHFCSGADLSWMKNSLSLSEEKNKDEALELAKLFRLIKELDKITIAYVQGACIGGGVGLAASCDFVVSDPDAFYVFSEVKLGLAPATIAPYIIQRIGYQKTKMFMLLGDRIESAKAEAIGLIDFIDSTGDRVGALLTELRKGGLNAQHKIKVLLNFLDDNSLQTEALDEYTSGMIADLRVSLEGQEGVKAFLEKRAPKW